MRPTRQASARWPLGRAAALLAVSVLAHAGIVAGPTLSLRAAESRVRPPLATRAGLPARVAAVALPVSVAAERRALVEEARADRVAGRLRLGEVLLRASEIDAREASRPLDGERARALYAERLERLRAMGGDDLRAAVPKVFGDLHYYGRAGGSMGQALLERGGSCEPLSHLIAAAIYDAGHADRAKLRFYGGVAAGGATHLAPVLPDGAAEHDLLAGTPSRSGGVLFEAAELIEVYARAHGLTPVLGANALGGPDGRGRGDEDGEDGEKDGDAAPPASTMARGYPPNEDRFSGAVPLYAHNAVHAPAESAGAEVRGAPAIDATDCAFFVRVASLDPPELRVDGREEFAVELRRMPSGAQLDRIFGVVQAVEQKVAAGGIEPTDKLMGLACLAALYDHAAVGFGLTSERDLAKLAAERGKKARTEAEQLLSEMDWGAPEGTRALSALADRYAGRSFLLLMLRGGDAPVMKLAGDVHRSDWGRVSALASLLVAPSTRRAGAALASRLTPAQQIQVMHEIFHAHDHQRPWASNYALDDAGDEDFVRAYRAFRGVAWGLWEGARPTDEVLSALLRETARSGLGRPWTTALLDYFGRNAVSLHQHRWDWQPFSTGLKRWLRVNGFTDMELFTATLADVE